MFVTFRSAIDEAGVNELFDNFEASLANIGKKYFNTTVPKTEIL